MTAPLRICVVAACPVPYPRGTPIRVTRLTEAVAALGHEVHLLTYAEHNGALDPRVHVHRIQPVPRVRVGRPGPSLSKLAVLDPLLAIRLRRLVREHRFDLIHAHHFEGLLVAATVRRRRIPTIFDAHTILENELPAYAPWIPAGLKRSVGRFLDHHLPSLADLVVAVSEPLREHLVAREFMPPERVAVIWNGVEVHRFGSGPALPPPPATGGILTYAGNLAAYQGIPHLLEAFAVVLRRRPASRLRIITDSSFLPFEALARQLGVRGQIDLCSATLETLPAELRRAHLAVNPRELCVGVPQKNLNYMAASLPLVAFAGSLHPARPGESGVAVSTISGAALGAAILDLLDHPEIAARMAIRARSILEAEHSWQVQAERLVLHYRALVPSASGG